MSVKNLLVNLPAFSRCGFRLNLSNLSSNSDASEIRAKASKIKRGFRNFVYNLKS